MRPRYGEHLRPILLAGKPGEPAIVIRWVTEYGTAEKLPATSDHLTQPDTI